MFALVNYVCLSQGYIRGRFVLIQRQFLIERAASVQIPALIRPWIMEQFNLIHRKAFLVMTFQNCLYVFSNCLKPKFSLPCRLIVSRLIFPSLCQDNFFWTSYTIVKLLLFLRQRIRSTHSF